MPTPNASERQTRRPLDYPRLQAWSAAWQLVAEHADDSQLGPSLPNLAAVALRTLDRKPMAALPSGGPPHAQLDRVRRALASRDPVTRLVTTRGARLRAAVARGSAATRADWIAGLLPVADGPTHEALVRRLTALLTRPRRPRAGELEAVAYLLHRRALPKHAGRHLVTLPREELGRQFLALRLPAAVPLLAADRTLARRAGELADAVLGAPGARDVFTLAGARPAAPLTDQLDDAEWATRAHRVLRCVRAAVRAAAGPGRPRQRPDAVARAAPAAVAWAVIDAYVAELAAVVCDASGRREARSGHAFPERAPRELVTDRLARTGLFRAEEGYWPSRLHAVDAAAGEGLRGAVTQGFARAAGASVRAGVGAADARALGLAVAEALAEALAERPETVDGGEPASRAEFDSLLDRALSARAVHARLGAELGARVPGLLAAAWPRLVRAAAPGAGRRATAWWRGWAAQAADRTPGEDLVRCCDWDAVSAVEMAGVVRGMAAVVDPIGGAWTITFDVPGLGAEGAYWHVGDVAFYDARRYDRGELRHREDAADPTRRAAAATSASAQVTADSPNQAIRLAAEAVATALDAVSLETGRRHPRQVIRWGVDWPAVVAKCDDEDWRGSWRAPSTERPFAATHAVADGMVAASASVPRLLLAPTERGEPALHMRLRRALRHLREAETADIPGRQFLAYWIALEAALGDSRDQTDVPPLGARLHVTWRDATGRCLSPNWRGRIRRAAARHLRPMAGGRGRRGPREPLDVALTVHEDRVLTTVSTKRDAYEGWLETLDPPPRFEPGGGPTGAGVYGPAIAAEVTYRRGHAETRLQRMYELRNALVHEALLYRPELELLAGGLGVITRDVLGKLADAVRRGARSVDDAQRALDRPWM